MKLRKLFMPGSLLLYAISVSALSAYQPAKWEPMDAYITDPHPGGPVRLRVFNEKGSLLEIADYSYDGEGRLLSERYSKPDGRVTGSTTYSYETGRLVSEELKNETGAVVSVKRFFYKNGEIQRTEVVQDGAVIMRHEFQIKEGRIVSGRETSGKESDRFSIEYRERSPVSIKFINEDGKVYTEILYSYDPENRISERVRVEEGTKSICRYSYKKGKIGSYQYFRTVAGKLIPEKRFEFEY